MWTKIAGIVLRNRIAILLILGILTVFMAYKAKDVQMSYEMAQILPKTDSTFIAYENFKKTFGKDGSVVVFGLNDSALYTVENYNAWYELTHDLKNITVEISKNGISQRVKGVEEALSIANIYKLKKNKAEKKLELVPVVQNKVKNQAELDSILNEIHNLPFYEGYLYKDSSAATVLALTLNREVLDSKYRKVLFEKINRVTSIFEENTGLKLHQSGLPLIRANSTSKVAEEIKLFIVLALLITSFILYLFFRSLKAVFFSMIVVFTGVIWAMGILSIFGYKITILTGLIPPLIIVIGIPNCVFILNKYHQEYKKHQNQIKALQRVIQKIGGAVFLTNVTTALGFGTFIFTNSRILVEFGTVAAIDIFTVFLLSVLILPIVLSFFPPPGQRHIKHLDNKFFGKVILWLEKVVLFHRNKVYATAIVIFLLGVLGISLMTTTGNIVDDLPKHDPIVQDLHFFEKTFGGVMPFEIMIDTKEKNGVFENNAQTLYKIKKLQKVISKYNEFSKPLSLVDAISFAYQAYKNGNKKFYILPPATELKKLNSYVKKSDENKNFKSFIDSTNRYTRVSIQMADIGTKQMDTLLAQIKPQVDSIFPKNKYNVTLTGTSVVFLKGTGYLVHNLFTSLALAILMISGIMAFLFSSFRMVLVSLIPNFLPLIVTAGLMGYFGIPIKPSTILIFSIAFGISVDDTIHFLAKYRQELKQHKWNMKEAALLALHETGLSMIYTSIILFFGFGIFTVSNFGGTVALGTLVSFTLLVAMLSNLLLLPSLLLSIDKRITQKAFKHEPFVEIIDEEEDIDLNSLEIATDNKNDIDKN
jgi:hypothetical protein